MRERTEPTSAADEEAAMRLWLSDKASKQLKGEAPPADGAGELDLVYGIVRELFTSEWDLERVLHAVVDHLSRWAGMERAMVTIVDAAGGEARVEASCLRCATSASSGSSFNRGSSSRSRWKS